MKNPFKSFIVNKEIAELEKMYQDEPKKVEEKPKERKIKSGIERVNRRHQSKTN